MDAFRRTFEKSLERHEHGLGFGIEMNGSGAKGAARERQKEREQKLAKVKPECARRGFRQPMKRLPFLAGSAAGMHFGIGPRHQTFHIFPGARLSGEGREPSQVRGAALVEIMEALHFRQRCKPVAAVLIEADERPVQFVPARPFGFDEARQIENHRICLRFTSRYWRVS